MAARRGRGLGTTHLVLVVAKPDLDFPPGALTVGLGLPLDAAAAAAAGSPDLAPDTAALSSRGPGSSFS